MEAIDTAIARQAAEWFVAHREGPPSARDRAAFAEWLRASPLHIREYLAIAGLARDVASAADTEDFDIERLITEAQASTDTNVIELTEPAAPRPRRRTLQWVAAAASVAAVLLIASPWLLDHATVLLSRNALQTAHGEQRIWRLTDGSVVHLNSGSKLKLRFTETERGIEILRGQALFNVTHDPRRPFHVLAGAAEVVAVGTAFDVYRHEASTVVTVVEGQVNVYEAEPGQRGPAAVSAVPAQPVSAGERIRIVAQAKPQAPEPIDVVKAVAWTQQQIVFDQERLGDVAAEFNRYGQLPIEIEDAALRELRITGIFNAYDTESFLGFISKLDGVEVQTTEDRIRVTAKRE